MTWYILGFFSGCAFSAFVMWVVQIISDRRLPEAARVAKEMLELDPEGWRPLFGDSHKFSYRDTITVSVWKSPFDGWKCKVNDMPVQGWWGLEWLDEMNDLSAKRLRLSAAKKFQAEVMKE